MNVVKTAFRPLLLLLLGLSIALPTFAALKPLPPKWELLGMRKVNFAVDRDEILVTRAEGVFTALQIKVKGAPIDLSRIIVHYGNGDQQEFETRTLIPAGGATRVLDLPGNKRVIRKVVFVYDTKNRAAHSATVELWGRH